MTKEYLVCTLLDNHQVGDTFTAWPLHITLVIWFDVDDLPKLTRDIANSINDMHQITTRASEERTWGEHTVNVLEDTPILHELHQLLLQKVQASGRLLVNQQYMGSNYTPHITHQGTVAKQPGDSVVIDAIYVVERNTDTKQKTVLDKIELCD